MRLAPRFRDQDSGFALGPGADPVPVRARPPDWLDVLLVTVVFAWIGGILPFLAGAFLMWLAMR